MRSGERSVVIVSCGRLNFPRFLRRNFVINTIQPLCAVSECVCDTFLDRRVNEHQAISGGSAGNGQPVLVCR